MENNKVAVITGGAKGIGRAITTRLAKDFDVVIINYHSSASEADELVEQLSSERCKVEAIQCDVSSFEAAKEFVDEIIKRHKRIDVLVNNAGITRDNLIMKMSEKEYDDVLTTNLKGTFNCIRFVSRYMVKQKYGRIINISSVTGVNGNAGQANYSASKAGIIGLTKSVAKELASRNITVNAVAPGFIVTDMTDAIPGQSRDLLLSQIPMKRFGTPDEVAHVVAFLASELTGYITGHVIKTDGGLAI